jgi:hypothetical protein
MFGRIFRRRQPAAQQLPQQAGPIQPTDRDIYAYWDGRQTKGADPLVLWNRLWTDPECAFEEVAPKATTFDLEIHQSLYALSRRVFEVSSLADGGLTDLECFALLNDFLRYAESLKKKLGPLPMPLRFLESELLAKARSRSTTPPAADSCSTPSESPGDEPTPSLKPCPPSSATP